MRKLLVSAVAFTALTSPLLAQTSTIQGLSANVVQQIDVISQDKMQRTPAQKKLDSTLIYAARDAAGLPQFPNAPALRLPQLSAQSNADANGQVLVDIKTTDANGTADQIRARGGSVVSALPQYNAVRASVPLATIETIAALPAVIAIRQADIGYSNAAEARRENLRDQLAKALSSGDAPPAPYGKGSVKSQAVVAHGADLLQDNSGITGVTNNGKICVMSDGTDSLSARVAAGELPNDVQILAGQGGSGDEGTAMLELIADMAPGAKLGFATAKGGKAQLAANIAQLAQNMQCRFIVDDWTYPEEAAFQEDVVAQTITDNNDRNNVLFFTAASNSGRLSAGTSGTWEGDFVNGGGGPAVIGGSIVHSFGANNYNTLTAIGQDITLQWSDPFGASSTDYDLYIVNAGGDTLLSASTTSQDGAQDPVEKIGCKDTSTGALNGNCLINARIYIKEFYAPTPRALRLDVHRGTLSVATAGSIEGHHAAEKAVTVAAVPTPNRKFNSSDQVETYSSDGLRRLFLNPNGTAITSGCVLFSCNGGKTLQKPDLAAGDCIATAASSSSGFNPFCGTSAAAPNAAAIAELIKSRSPSLVNFQILARMKATAIDIMGAGADRDSGVGIVMADAAVLGLRIGRPHDFNHDGKSDILWRNSGGDVYVWTMDGATVSSVAGLGNVATNWSIVGQRDFNGDGNTDILWTNTSGAYVIWFMNGASVVSVANLGIVATNWSVVGTGDFDGDNKGDILWRSTAGDTVIWFMNGSSVASVGNLGRVTPNWFVAGTADFNSNLRTDILWRNSTGDNAIWYMNGASVASVLNLGNIPTNWSIVATGTFNNNGAGNILWRNSGGDTAVWYFNNGTVSQVLSLGNVPTNWSVVSAGDFDVNSSTDILWRNTDGANVIWFFNNARVSATTAISGVAPNWSVQSANAN